MSSTSLSQTVIRALDILSLFKTRKSITLKQVVEETGLSTTIAYRLLQSLVSKNYLSYSHTSKEYALGTEILILGHRAIDRQSVQQLAAPFMLELTNVTGYASLLNIRAGTFSLCLDKVDAETELDVCMRPGKTYPLHAGATSIVLLAFEDEAFREGYLRTLDDREERACIAQEITKIQEQRYAFSVGRLTDGGFSISFPLFDRSRKIVASLSMGGAAASLTDEGKAVLVEKLRDASKQISYLLGYMED